jgi:ATP-dependent protease HslVU (ClpYQ) peptidase subunit
MRNRKDCKVHKIGPVILGFCGSFRVCQIVAHTLNLPARLTGTGIEKYMAVSFTEAVRECLKIGSVDDSEMSESEILIGYQGRIFNLSSGYQIEEVTQPYNAIGSGGNVAMGALYALHGTAMDPEARVKVALKAAEQFCTEVQGPFRIIHS